MTLKIREEEVMGLDTNPYRKQVEEKTAHRDAIYAQIDRIGKKSWRERKDYEYHLVDALFNKASNLNTEIADLRKKALEVEFAERDAAWKQRDQEMAEREAQERLYRRPRYGWAARLFNPMLGPLPTGFEKTQPTKENLQTLPSYRLAAMLTVVVAICLLVTLSSSFEWLRMSPLSLLTQLLSFLGPYGSGVAAMVCTVLMLKGVSDNGGIYDGKLLDRFAGIEEHWFRSGAENWSTLQRFNSCVAFGLVHVVNMFYPLASLITLMFVGAVYMAVYLREFKRSNDSHRATMASTKFHATYNRFAVAYMCVALSITGLNLFF